MNKKVGIEYTIPTSTGNNLNGFTRKKLDGNGMPIKDDSIKDSKDASATRLNNNTQVGRTVERGGDNAAKPAVATTTTGATKTPEKTDKDGEKSTQRENFFNAKADANGLKNLTSGNKQAGQAVTQQDLAVRQNIQDNKAPQASAQAPVQQNTASMQAGTAAPVAKPKVAQDVPQGTKQAPEKGGVTTAESVKKATNAEGAQVQQQLGQKTAGQPQAGQAAASQATKESKQQILDGDDNKDGEVKKEEDTPQSAYLAAQKSNKNLDGLLGGMNAGVGGDGAENDSEPEVKSLAIKSQKSLPDSALIDEKSGDFPLASKLGTKIIYSEDSVEQASSKLAAADYKKNVEQALSKFTQKPLEEVIENNRYGTSLVARIVAETKKELEMAGLLLDQMRGRRCEKLVG